jgi:tetratricopeptide (TPR) repeat protein
MGYAPGKPSPFAILFALALFVALTVSPLLAQHPGGRPGARGSDPPVQSFVTILVSVRESSGMPLAAGAFVKLSSNFSSVHATAATRDGGTATFPNVSVGDYDIEVESSGYQTAREHTSAMIGAPSYTVYVYMHPEGEALSGSVPGGKPTMTPRLQSEIDKGRDKMRRQQYEPARAHFEKAAKMAPGNPDVQYLLGMLEYSEQHFDLARTKFEAAISIYPHHDRALVALGELQLRNNQPAQASQTLEKAFLVNGADWRTHYLLAYAYAGQEEYEKAQPHAERAADLGKEHGAPARLLLGHILAAEGKSSDAKRAFGTVIRDFPNDPAAADAKFAVAELNKPVMIASAAASVPAAEPAPLPAIPAIPATPPVIRTWAPPDVDAKEYVLASDVACSEDELLHRTQDRTAQQLANFEKFMATEHIEHQEVDAYGNPGPIRAKDFDYIVFVNRPRKGYLNLEEDRDGGENLAAFPTPLATQGLVGLGIYLFDPDYVVDLSYKCEGLGEWRGQAAWQIRFEQRKEAPSRIRTWRNNRGVFPVPLRGRVWVAANSYDLLHIETDLREPLPDLELARDHLIIDYGPVKFAHANTSLWLPWYAELYMQLHGKRYHHRHTLTNYTLFSVDTQHQISAPKED